MEREEILAQIEERGLSVDDGALIGGPFIPDGRYRIYCPDTLSVVGEGRTLEEAFGIEPCCDECAKGFACECSEAL